MSLERGKMPQETARDSNAETDYGITRLDYAKSKGWWVRLYRPGSKKPDASKLFSDSAHNGYEAARIAARKWRDEKMAELDIQPRKWDGNGHFTMYSRNRSGKIGVRLCHDYKAGRISRVYWEAKFMVNGKQRVRSYSVRKYGYECAWRLAIAERQRHDGEPVPDTVPERPDWLVAVAATEGLTL
ncbi:hypothetical protein HF670_04940 [Acidithiobacillus thiooxidans]|jgi:hypothetical protein|uniref:Uncharacterized protein n=3 Tax=Acidithiobacillus thiooxidans TaxID=930 RepID=A0A1C2I7L4_ACITH|nr:MULTISPECIES: AP2 domain-containing protein [Acidithiobacillus]MBU2838919.1 hypothetical protein [Acidithiobacillus thiooxidans]MBU2843285.1 hypothetical protein [Acidithiobacillus thiooxidans]OCX71958.1 hypothetical protein A6M23_10765 [Acidithiobacillus thiooxidans]OCX86508.1 hypothetical protein A6P08_05835 [Acidithiobacillus thiooxidans]